MARAPFWPHTGAVLMGAHNGGVDHHVFIVVIAGQQFEDALENPSALLTG